MFAFYWCHDIMAGQPTPLLTYPPRNKALIPAWAGLIKGKPTGFHKPLIMGVRLSSDDDISVGNSYELVNIPFVPWESYGQCKSSTNSRMFLSLESLWSMWTSVDFFGWKNIWRIPGNCSGLKPCDEEKTSKRKIFVPADPLICQELAWICDSSIRGLNFANTIYQGKKVI